MTKLIPREIITEIFKNLSLKELIENETVCKSFMSIIRTTKWDQFVVKLKDTNRIEYVRKNYNFTKYDFIHSSITDDILKMFVNCHTLDLSWCNKITDERNYNKLCLL
jgi:hypothetical protein